MKHILLEPHQVRLDQDVLEQLSYNYKRIVKMHFEEELSIQNVSVNTGNAITLVMAAIDRYVQLVKYKAERNNFWAFANRKEEFKKENWYSSMCEDLGETVGGRVLTR